MRPRLLILLLAASLTLSGCSLLNRQYSVVEEHTSKYWDSDSGDTLRAENYQDIVNDLLLLVGQHKQKATVMFYNNNISPIVADLMEQAATEVQTQTPLGAYAVSYITSEITEQHSYDEIVVHISYRRSEEQLQAIVNATTTAALSDLLDKAVIAGRSDLTVRIGYWDDSSARRVSQAVAAAQQRWGLGDRPAWTIFYYPTKTHPGLIEIVMRSDES